MLQWPRVQHAVMQSVHKQITSTLNELKQPCNGERAKIPPRWCESLIKSYVQKPLGDIVNHGVDLVMKTLMFIWLYVTTVNARQKTQFHWALLLPTSKGNVCSKYFFFFQGIAFSKWCIERYKCDQICWVLWHTVILLPLQPLAVTTRPK